MITDAMVERVARAISKEVWIDADHQFFERHARAALEAAIPPGWRVVPPELSDEMRAATWRDQFMMRSGIMGYANGDAETALDKLLADEGQKAQDQSAYRAMLAAAPEPGA